MKPKTSLVFIVIVLGILVVTLTGCVENEPSLDDATHTTSSSTAESHSQASASKDESQILTPLAAWWDPQWSDDGLDLDVRYTGGRNALSEVISVGKSYTPFGVPVQGSEVTHRTGEDIYGREQNMTIGVLAGWHGTLKPESVVAYGTFSAPARFAYEDGWFTRSLNVTVISDFDEAGRLTGGSVTETFSGHIKAVEGKITYSGTATATFSAKNGALLWTDRIEKTTYYYAGEKYAETVTVVTPESELRGGSYVKMRETVQTTTTYADGGERESMIMVEWQRKDTGLITGKSGSGTVSGIEIVNGKPINYEGEIMLDYGVDTRIGWFKTGYTENRSATTNLPKRLPFEVIYSDDLYLRPVF
jgi:hypothetical protein